MPNPALFASYRLIFQPARFAIRFILVMLAALLLVGCNLASSASLPVPAPTATAANARLSQMLPFTPVPTLERLVRSNAETQSVAVASTDTADVPNGEATPDSETLSADDTDTDVESSADTNCETAEEADSSRLTQHTVNAKIDYAAHSLQARQTIIYTNRTGTDLSDLVINVEANHWLEAFTLLGLLQHSPSGENFTPQHSLTGKRLYIELDEPLSSDCAITLELAFTIVVPQMRGGVEAFDGYFGVSPRQINIGHWLPAVAARQNEEWITRQAMFIGEQEVVEKADWDVTIEVENAADTLKIAAPGDVETLGNNRWRYQFLNARDFALSLSESFNVTKMPSELGVMVELYSFPDAQVITATGVADGAMHAANLALRSLETYARLFGDYPYKRMVVVQGDFPDGMEFSGLVFVSTNWFTSYTGEPASFLTLITIHEVSHQWWYARVGNDPANSPWLDEALATYSEYVFFEQFYPSLKDWWWDFRVNSHSPTGFVDSKIYEFNSIREYINAVYLRGVRMLHALRTDLGTEAFFDLLRKYADAGDGLIADGDFFWSMMTPEQLERTQNTRSAFLRQPIPQIVSAEE